MALYLGNCLVEKQSLDLFLAKCIFFFFCQDFPVFCCIYFALAIPSQALQSLPQRNIVTAWCYRAWRLTPSNMEFGLMAKKLSVALIRSLKLPPADFSLPYPLQAVTEMSWHVFFKSCFPSNLSLWISIRVVTGLSVLNSLLLAWSFIFWGWPVVCRYADVSCFLMIDLIDSENIVSLGNVLVSVTWLELFNLFFFCSIVWNAPSLSRFWFVFSQYTAVSLYCRYRCIYIIIKQIL